MSALRLKKGINNREETIQAALTGAAEAPRKMMLLANTLVDDASTLLKDGNKNLITDTAMVAVLLEATIRSAEYNVLINLKSISNHKYLQEVNADLEKGRQNLAQLNEIAERIRSSLAPEKC